MSKHTVSGMPIEVSASLRSYVSIQRQFSAKTDETIAAIDENARFYHSSLKQVSLIITYINMFIDDLIRSLSQDYNYYDCTRDDFLLNDGYSQLMHIRQEFDSYCNQLKTSNNAQANLRLSIAAQEASSKITGLGFGIISNSLVAHLIYLAQNESTIRKQAAEAQTYFEEQEKQIRSQGEQKVESESRDYYNRVFMPRLRTVTRQIYSGALVSYLRILDKLDVISLDSIQNYDYERSQQILNNLVGSSNREQVIATALSICPFNVDIYTKASEYGILNEELVSLADDVGITKELSAIIKPQHPQEDEIIEKEINRFLSQDVDRFDDSWKTRANTYLREARCLQERFPNSFAGYGLVASYLIAANWETRNGSFWPEVKYNIEKFFELHTGNESYTDWFDGINDDISKHFDTYFDIAEDTLDSYVQDNNERSIWNSVALVKRSEIPALEAVQFYIQCIGKHFGENYKWKVKIEKNNLLWYVYRFCTPFLIQKFVGGNSNRLEKIYYHLPLSERQFAINLYNELIADGVGDYESGSYSFYKKNETFSNSLQNMERMYGPGVYRSEISPVGMKFLTQPQSSGKSGGCYIATCVYGSYDCPQVWTLRRYRDNTLAHTWYGRAFIRTYYAISPTLVKYFGHRTWFKKYWKSKLDTLIANLHAAGVEDSPYKDKNWG